MDTLPRRRCRWNARVLAAVCLAGTWGAASQPARALPAGRSWATTEAVGHPGIVNVRAGRLEVDGEGNPFLIIGARREGTAEREWTLFDWRDSLWAPRLFTGTRASFFPEHVLSFVPGQSLVWISTVRYPDGLGPLLISQLLPEPTPPETILATYVQSSEYGAAASFKRRWAARSDQRPGTFTNWIRVSYSDTTGIWRPLPELGRFGADEFMCAIAPLSDRRAVVAYSAGDGLSWAIADGDTWIETGNLDPRRGGPLHPHFAFRPSGGLWLLWTDRHWVHVSSYRDGAWDRGDSTRCARGPAETFWSVWSDISRGPYERPLLAWGDLGVGSTFRDVGCVAFPTESGWAPGDEIPGSEGLFSNPKVTRDRNGDAWLMWDLRGLSITRFTHTYVSATTSAPILAGAGRHRVLSWTLSEPAPESWWAVMRARGRGDFEQVARLRAGETTEMSWTDDSPPGGVLRYKIRRESVDSRYLWESKEAHWPPGQARLRLRLAVPGPTRPHVESASAVALEVEEAAGGPLDIALYDLQGRLVHRQRPESGGTGQDAIRLDLSLADRPLTPGIYFVRAQDAAGRSSDVLKIAILK